ncbi:protein of unknown function (DUF1905) [Parafrankia irregularis]|uniref:DUF1905 domain-containing protein n=1 Tax=Parafrankia irregularis TaxID=795642 RepID=A0A0S4QYB2_9ACTN|nr:MULTISPECIES: DUF1905 domain-containing protein [Parafrankia]EFC85164.1 protein of unknown function DUF1905 [Parafrankia sp. EUN1f]MBE3203599.1 DUF1905 domain-containing protein [Parafrankia sp. CH37]CUU60535.1 protein of unknown function (DUF1905) [Parafrankia irregularis]
MIVVFESELWEWAARRPDSWVFVSLPVDVSEEIRDLTGGLRRGFGSLRVRATLGGSTWRTSIFPDSKRGSYVLPVKRAVRKAEALEIGDVTSTTIELLDA